MKIIEFAGLPGCGKSTLCSGVIEKLRKNYKVYTYQEIVRMVSTPRRKRLYDILLHMSSSCRRFRRLLKAYAGEYNDVSSQAMYVLMALYGMPKVFQCIAPKSVVVLDEGFVQTLTSIPHLQPIRDNDTLSEITTYLNARHYIQVVCCTGDEMLTIRRLRTRNRGDRFTSIKDDETLCQALHRKQQNIDIVAKHFFILKKITMEDGTDTLNKNINDIYRSICEIV